MAEDTIKDEEYAPITKGLREYIERHPTMMHAVGLTDLCDNIDAIHKALEEHNAKLHEKVLNQRKQLAEVQEAIERRNNGVLKRRWQKKMDALKNENEEMRNFNCRVREAIRRHEDLTLWGTDYTALPVDADGVPIHVGDEMIWYSTSGKWPTRLVAAITNEGFITYDEALGGYAICQAAHYRHYHKPTVEDVLCELLDKVDDDRAGQAEIIAEYAAKLQLVDGDAE